MTPDRFAPLRELAEDWGQSVNVRRNELAVLLAVLLREHDEATRERDTWRWLHWGHPEESWACPCGMANGSGVNQCVDPDCLAWRPMKATILAEVQAGAVYDAAMVAKYRAVPTPNSVSTGSTSGVAVADPTTPEDTNG